MKENRAGAMDKQLNTNNLLRFSHVDAKIHHKKSNYQGFFKLDEYQLSHKLFSGAMSEVITREIFERGDAVVMMPYDPKSDKVLLLEQFRPGAIREQTTPWLLEFVAGMFAPDERPADVAIREAYEEAGLHISPDKLLPIMKYFSSPGGMTEYIHLYVGLIDINEETHDPNNLNVFGLVEEGEDILLHVVSRIEAMELLEQGKINNAATIIGLQWLALNYKQMQQERL